MPDQYLRKCSLVVSVSGGSDGLDLSELRVVFRTSQADTQAPNNAAIRVYNLSDETSNQIEKEFTRVTLQAGYQEGAFGIIFDGGIKQTRRGRENATDTYLDLLCADGDQGYNFGVVNTSLAAGSTPAERLKAATDAMAGYGVQQGYTPELAGGILARGKVLYGMARNHLNQVTQTTGTTWSIQNGQVQVLPLTGYLPGEAVVLTSKTGLIGQPEQTEQGIRAKCLLNPKIVCGGLVKINNADINRTVNLTGAPVRFDQYTGLQLLATVADDGLYRVYVAEYEGDTWGNEWSTDLTCLAVNPSVPAGNSVKAYG